MKHFIKQWLRHPKKVGAVMPSSRRLARLITDTPHLRQASAVVEIGPGTGAFTTSILEQKRPDALFLAVELNGTFVQMLKHRHPGVEFYHDSAAHVQTYLRKHGRETCDCIICGMPWGIFDETLQRSLLAAICDVLEPGGEISTFAYLGGPWLKPGRRFKRMLPEYFSKVTVSRMIWMNMPPAFVYRCVK